MGILGVLSNDHIEVFDGQLVVLDHLVRLGSFVDVPDLRRDFLDTLGERVDALFELLQVAVSQTDVIVGVSQVGLMRPG